MFVKLQFPCAYPHEVSTDPSKVVVVMCIHKLSCGAHFCCIKQSQRLM